MNIFDRPFLERGFRPFFFLGAFYSFLTVLIWGRFFAGQITPPSFMLDDPILWHAHEMVYGYAMAIVAGFLLTAVANWTGGAPTRQFQLAALCAVWVAGRLVMNIDFSLPPWLVYSIDCSFLPVLAISLAIPLLKSRNTRNFIFLGLLTVLFLCDVAFFVLSSATPLYIALMVILTMVSLIGGRIIPAFTVSALRRKGMSVFQIDQKALDIAALLSLIALILILGVWGYDNIIFASFCSVSSLIHAARLRYFYSLKTFFDPMLWILHVGYIWLVIGLILLAVSGFGFIPFSIALHALTVGCIGSMTIGMMCRVALGHTGRDIHANRVTTLMFLLMQIAAVLRVSGPLIYPQEMAFWIISSSTIWSLVFFVYLLSYGRILLTSRKD